MRHLWIPDTQVREGVPTDHIAALGRYIEDKRPDKIIVAGDWWDMPATSNHNTAEDQEGLRVIDDIQSGKRAMNLMWREVDKRNRTYSQWKKRKYQPECHFLMGNHEAHLERIWQNDPRLIGLIDYSCFGLEERGFTVHPFKQIATIDGIAYSHFFYNPGSGRIYSGMMETRLKNIGCSFTQGHMQEFMYGERQLPNGKRLHGLISGAFYMHDEDYKGPQGNNHWRGIVMKNQVYDGEYDICKVSLKYLLEKYG